MHGKHAADQRDVAEAVGRTAIMIAGRTAVIVVIGAVTGRRGGFVMILRLQGMAEREAEAQGGAGIGGGRKPGNHQGTQQKRQEEKAYHPRFCNCCAVFHY